MIIVWLLCSQENRIYCLWFFKEAAWGGLKTWASIPPLSQEKFVINERRWSAGADNTMTRARAWHHIRAPEQHWLLTIRNTFPIPREYWLCAINKYSCWHTSSRDPSSLLISWPHKVSVMTDQSGGGSPVWLGVALIFVGLASKDLFISDNQGELLHYVTSHHNIDSLFRNYSNHSIFQQQCLVLI